MKVKRITDINKDDVMSSVMLKILFKIILKITLDISDSSAISTTASGTLFADALTDLGQVLNLLNLPPVKTLPCISNIPDNMTKLSLRWTLDEENVFNQNTL